MSLPDVLTIDSEGNLRLGMWIPNPVRAKCGVCRRGTFYYQKPKKKRCAVCRHRIVYRYPGFWKAIPFTSQSGKNKC